LPISRLCFQNHLWSNRLLLGCPLSSQCSQSVFTSCRHPLSNLCNVKRAEPSPILKAAIRLLITVFTAAMEMSEFQRQVSLPHVPKFTSALSNIAASNEDIELKVRHSRASFTSSSAYKKSGNLLEFTLVFDPQLSNCTSSNLSEPFWSRSRFPQRQSPAFNSRPLAEKRGSAVLYTASHWWKSWSSQPMEKGTR
jgi:hypothetical protein